ncbi:hypothetical protein AABB24_013034, partial [Solanum stoloniferum]
NWLFLHSSKVSRLEGAAKPSIPLGFSPKPCNFISTVNLFSISIHPERFSFSMAIAAARSIFRSPSLRNAASRIASEAKAARSPLRTPSKSPLSHRIFRCPSEMSACLESLQPYHTVTASALMTSMLTDSLRSYSWLSEGVDKTR